MINDAELKEIGENKISTPTAINMAQRKELYEQSLII